MTKTVMKLRVLPGRQITLTHGFLERAAEKLDDAQVLAEGAEPG